MKVFFIILLTKAIFNLSNMITLSSIAQFQRSPVSLKDAHKILKIFAKILPSTSQKILFTSQKQSQISEEAFSSKTHSKQTFSTTHREIYFLSTTAVNSLKINANNY